MMSFINFLVFMAVTVSEMSHSCPRGSDGLACAASAPTIIVVRGWKVKATDCRREVVNDPQNVRMQFFWGKQIKNVSFRNQLFHCKPIVQFFSHNYENQKLQDR